MEFVVNVAFYEILRQHNPKLVSKIKLNIKTKPQVFNVRLFGDIKGPLDQPTHLKEIISKLDDTGCRERSQTQAKPKEEPILTKSQSNILVIACTFLATLVGVGLAFLAVRHVKLKALVAGLALVTAAPVTEARNSHAATKEPLIMPDKVICTDPILTGFATAASIAALFIFVYMQCHGLSWIYGYKYHRYCTLFMFVYNNDRYAPIKIKHLKGHLHMYRIENSLDPTNLKITKFFLWDTLNIDWNDLKLYMSNQSVQLPKSVTIPLKHKIKTRNLITGDDMDVQFMIKQGSTWYNLTNTSQWNRSAEKGCPYTWCKRHNPESKDIKPKSAKTIEV